MISTILGIKTTNLRKIKEMKLTNLQKNDIIKLKNLGKARKAYVSKKNIPQIIRMEARIRRENGFAG